MRTALVLILLILLTTAAFAQDPAAVSAAEAACGPKGVNFDVRNDNSQHTVAQPGAGKALVYVIQDIGTVMCFGNCVTVKVALDGAWVGANRHNSYFSFAVDPGERHLCAKWQSHSGFVSLVHFTAEAGKVYYFRTSEIVGAGSRSQAVFYLDPIDSDLGKFFVASYPLSVSHPKKATRVAADAASSGP